MRAAHNRRAPIPEGSLWMRHRSQDDADEPGDVRTRPHRHFHDHGPRSRKRESAEPMTPEERAFEQARRRANQQIGFLSHGVAYGAVCFFLLFVAGFKTAFIVALAWGIGLVSHFFAALVAPELRRRYIAREVEREVKHSAPRERRTLEERHVRSLEELSASIAHEIRNPITAAKSLVQQMGEDPASTENVEYAKVALEELDRVERSVAHLLRFAREEEIRMTDLRLADVIGSAVATLRDRATSRGVALDVQVGADCALRGDAEKLRRVLINLVGNALDALESARVGVAAHRGDGRREPRRHRVLGARARQRPGHRARGARPDLQPLLHLEGARHRTRSRHLEEAGGRARRLDRGAVDPRRRRGVHDHHSEAGGALVSGHAASRSLRRLERMEKREARYDGASAGARPRRIRARSCSRRKSARCATRRARRSARPIRPAT